jgi:hypothetical protein
MAKINQVCNFLRLKDLPRPGKVDNSNETIY